MRKKVLATILAFATLGISSLASCGSGEAAPSGTYKNKGWAITNGTITIDSNGWDAEMDCCWLGGQSRDMKCDVDSWSKTGDGGNNYWDAELNLYVKDILDGTWTVPVFMPTGNERKYHATANKNSSKLVFPKSFETYYQQ